MKFNPKRAVQRFRLEQRLALVRMRRIVALFDPKDQKRREDLGRLRAEDWR